MKFVRRSGGGSALGLLKHYFLSTRNIMIGGKPWYFRISEGEFEWAVSLTASDDRWNPSSLYAYVVHDPKIGEDYYIVWLYPRGCADAACAHPLHTEAGDGGIFPLLRDIARIYERYYYSDPIKFFDKLGDLDVYELEPDEVEQADFNIVRPSPSLGRKLADELRRRFHIETEHTPIPGAHPEGV